MKYEHNEYPTIDGIKYKVVCESNDKGEIEDWHLFKLGKVKEHGNGQYAVYERVVYKELKENKLIEKVNDFIDTLTVDHILEEQTEVEEEEEYLSKDDIAGIRADMKFHEMRDEGLI